MGRLTKLGPCKSYTMAAAVTLCHPPNPRQRTGARRFAVALLTVLLAACSGGEGKHDPKASQAPPAVPVIASQAAVKTVPVQMTAVGTVQPYVSVAVKARIDGQVEAVHFREGDTVRPGQRLFSLDPRPLQAQLAQAEANLAKDRAVLANARRQSERYADLLQRNFISREAYNQIRTTEATARATVEADAATVKNARVQLAYATIAAPIGGVAGRVLIQQGNMVKANDTNPMVVINQVTPIYVEFSLPEQNLDAVRQAMGRGPVAVELANGPAPGKLSFVDNTVDPATGMIRLRATFPNRERALWPGQFVNARVVLGEQRDALVVPAQAVQSGPEGPFVYVVKPDSTAEVRKVKPLRTVANDTVIGQGVAAGELVVIDGQSRLAPGARVRTQDRLAGSAPG